MRWQPSLGAWREGNGTRFRVWAPEAKLVEVIFDEALDASLPEKRASLTLQKSGDGYFEGISESISVGGLYRYRVDGQGPYPDPASRYQPQGVQGPSQVVDATGFGWTDQEWTGVELEDLILYELHVGTFTPQGTFAAAAEKLPEIRDLGVTAIELMPLADFAGERNWGYDGVALFAPARCYGTPDDLREFVNRAHRLGLGVHLDVVYNHFGPDGAYVGQFSPYYFSRRHRSPWGAAINFDGLHGAPVRYFFMENALHWIQEYHLDGLRLDATHAIVDESPRHFLADLSAAIRDSLRDSPRRAVIVAEDTRNLACMIQPEAEGGWGLDGVWSDDFHHQVRRNLAGDHEAYFQDFDGTLEGLAETARRGWFYCGQYAPFFHAPRGSNPGGISLSRFVFFLQNHDQVGNRAFGDRLHHQMDLPTYRAATALLLLLPETPLLFMGQEWAASAPFRFFTDHNEDLGNRIREGRRNEFRAFASFADPRNRDRIPDPQALATFQACRLNWEERGLEPHLSLLRFYTKLLALRRSEPALRAHGRENFDIAVWNAELLILRRQAAEAPPLLGVIRLHGSGRCSLPGRALAAAGAGREWEVLLTSEDRLLAVDPLPPRMDLSEPAFEFARPGAVILRAAERGGKQRSA